MLQAQVNYWNLQENIRHNLATEQLGRDTLTESIRHSMETESQGRTGLTLQQEMNRIQARNASTNYVNAMTNARKAEIESFKANTEAYKARTARDLGYGNLAVAQTDASSRAVQAQAAAQQAKNAAKANSIRSEELYYKNVERASDIGMRGVENLIKLGGLYGKR